MELTWATGQRCSKGCTTSSWRSLRVVKTAEVTWDDSFPGMRRFYAADPFGNRLELLEPLP